MTKLSRAYTNTHDAEYYRHRARLIRETRRLVEAAQGTPKKDPFAGVDEIPQMPDPMPMVTGGAR